MKINKIDDAISTLDGVSGLLMMISCSYDTPDYPTPNSKYTGPAYGLLSDLVKSASDFLSEHDVDIEQALNKK